jgi:hypothetical protein
VSVVELLVVSGAELLVVSRAELLVVSGAELLVVSGAEPFVALRIAHQTCSLCPFEIVKTISPSSVLRR